MAIVQSVDFHAFKQAFEDFNRKDQFSPVALRALFDYLEDLSDDTGKPVELDVIGLCCEFYEMSYTDAAANYRIDVSEDEGIRDAVLDYIGSESTIIGYNDDTIVFVAF